MANRLTLDQTLKGFTNNVYYQPPTGTIMKYPAIRYRRNDIDIRHADNISYTQTYGYEIIVIDRDPDSQITREIAKLSGIRYVRSYQADSLNHDVFAIYW